MKKIKMAQKKSEEAQKQLALAESKANKEAIEQEEKALKEAEELEKQQNQAE